MTAGARPGIAIVIPARDEAETIARCLRSVQAARRRLAVRRPEVPTALVVVADSCRDRTAQIAESLGVAVLRIEARSVGRARREGAEAAIRMLGGAHADHWIACTDADSVVPPQWLVEAVRSRDDGVDLVLGTVRPEFAGLPGGYRSWWFETHPRGRPNGHVHGANLGVRGSAYAAVDGFAPREVDEDVDLVRRLRTHGFIERHSDAAEVVTSARREGRAPGGYAAFVAAQAGRFEE